MELVIVLYTDHKFIMAFNVLAEWARYLKGIMIE